MKKSKHSSMKVPSELDGKKRPQFTRSLTVQETVRSNSSIKSQSPVKALPEEHIDGYDGKVGASKRRKSTRRHDETCQQKTTTCLKRACLYVLSYAGLITIVVLYSVFGGFLFKSLEANNEEKVHEKAIKLRETFVEDIMQKLNASCEQLPTQNATNTSSSIQTVLSNNNLTNELNKLTRDMMLKTYNLVKDGGWLGEHDANDDGRKWTLAGALLFSVTVITTIGYGSVTPKTKQGKIATMFYALLGIPLTILCISKIGKAMASLFRALYGGTFCLECRQKFFQSVSARHGNAVGQDLSPDSESVEEVGGKEGHEHKTTEVPIFICMLLMILYIIVGAFLFQIWEEKWSFFDGAYFCFITLSTIGFGDIVPGFTYKDWADQVKQVACSLYLLVGLSTLAMCFDLIQQRAVRLANNLGRCIGLKTEQE